MSVKAMIRVGPRVWGVTFWREHDKPATDDPGRVISGDGRVSLAPPPQRTRRSPTRSTVIAGFAPPPQEGQAP